jgi:pyruvate dehydrogenase E1 component
MSTRLLPKTNRCTRAIANWSGASKVSALERDGDGRQRQSRARRLGGHISTFASCATLYEVGFNHFFHGGDGGRPADLVYFQGHASPGQLRPRVFGTPARRASFANFRQELAEGGGLSSYPHPYLMPDFWQFPTVSMGLGPIMSIYQARFSRYLRARGLVEGDEPKIWCFVGDGESDEPETLGALTLASREGLDNLVWVVNCNLQRLDGPCAATARSSRNWRQHFAARAGT